MRELTEQEKSDLRARCAGLDFDKALIEGGRWLAEHLVMNWTSDDVAVVLFGKKLKKAKK